MNKMTFKPALAIDATKHLDNIQYPKYASLKLDGIRCIFHPTLGMVSRALKKIPNKQLQQKFRFLTEYSKNVNRILDGELYAHDLTFQDITRVCMTKDFDDPVVHNKIKKEKGETDYMNYITDLLSKTRFHCFDKLDMDNPYHKLHQRVNYIQIASPHVKYVNQIEVKSSDEVRDMFKGALEAGYEGLILRCPESEYKFGRSTLKEENMLKVKPFETFDLVVTGVIERMENTNESFKNELNQSTKRNTIDNKKETGIAACFEVIYNDLPMKVTITGEEDFRREIWSNKEDYIGKTIEVKGMNVGAKDVLRHPTFVRFREDK